MPGIAPAPTAIVDEPVAGCRAHRSPAWPPGWDRERAATEIAALSALGKPAASRHLRVLREAGLVRVRAGGSRRFYASDPARVGALRDALEAFWGDRLARMRDAAEADLP